MPATDPRPAARKPRESSPISPLQSILAEIPPRRFPPFPKPETPRSPIAGPVLAQSLLTSCLAPAIAASLPRATPPLSCSPPPAPLLRTSSTPAKSPRHFTSPPSFRQNPAHSSTGHAVAGRTRPQRIQRIIIHHDVRRHPKLFRLLNPPRPQMLPQFRIDARSRFIVREFPKLSRLFPSRRAERTRPTRRARTGRRCIIPRTSSSNAVQSGAATGSASHDRHHPRTHRTRYIAPTSASRQNASKSAYGGTPLPQQNAAPCCTATTPAPSPPGRSTC